MAADPAGARKSRKAATRRGVAAGGAGEKITKIPDREALVTFIKAQPGGIGKREIAKAFNLKGADRIELKRMLRALEEDGVIEKGGKRFSEQNRDPRRLPPVTLLEAGPPDADGDQTATPANWDRDNGPPPRIVMAAPRRHDPALGPGDRFLGRLKALEGDADYAYQASILKKLGRGGRRVLGLFREAGTGPKGEGGRIEPVDKRQSDDFIVPAGETGGARDGELVEAEIRPGKRFGLAHAKVIERLGDASEPKAISLIAIHEQGLPVEFSEAALADAAAAAPLTEEQIAEREDLRHLDLVTIDPADARDHDDAVYAAADPADDNLDGWLVWVAIADVAAYVRPGSDLDAAAAERGNSAYFPDRVVPMLPESLSADLCSLHEGVDRPCLALRMRLTARGEKLDHSFHRGVMRSRASLTYEQAQAAWEGRPDAAAAPLLEGVIAPLYNAFHAAQIAREKRGPLDLDLPERRVELDETGQVSAIRFRDRFDAHRLIEEFMILANVCAAETLEKARIPLLYRVHEPPDPLRIEALREVLDSIDIPLAKGQAVTPKRLNQALEAAAGSDHLELVNMSVLRSQMQAVYSPENLGHFGLSLRAYAHFTSPIRRYADLIVHRALIRALKLAPTSDGLTEEQGAALPEIAQHISTTERRAMTAERDTVDRYLAAWLADQEGAQFEGRIAGVQRFGLFVKLAGSGADGFVPIASIGAEYFHFDQDAAQLVGDRSGLTLQLGMPVTVRLVEATPVTGGLILQLLDPLSTKAQGGERKASARATPGGSRGKAGRPARGAPRGKLAKAKAARKSKRSR
ncbi:MAG: ribonuclease R [Pseudomonadota bacterium]